MLIIGDFREETIPGGTTSVTLSTGCFYLSKDKHFIPDSVRELTLEWDISAANDIELEHIITLNIINVRLNDILNMDKCVNVKKLSLDRCNSLEKIKFPPNLVYLNIANCNCLSEIDTLPDSLETLIITECNSLMFLPRHKPKNIKVISIKNCSSLFVV